MWLTPLQAAVVAVLVIAYVVVTRFNAVGPRITSLQRSQAAAASPITDSRSDFEKEHHLVVAPPLGTPVALITDSRYLREYHCAAPGQLGTVIMHTQLTSGDTGVLVNWGNSPKEMVRMDLNELRLAPHA